MQLARAARACSPFIRHASMILLLTSNAVRDQFRNCSLGSILLFKKKIEAMMIMPDVWDIKLKNRLSIHPHSRLMGATEVEMLFIDL